MTHREFVVVRVALDNGVEGWSFTLTRDGAIDAQIERFIAPVYQGTLTGDREETYAVAKRRSLPSHSSGIGLRGLSLVDLALWDAAAKEADLSIAEMLGGSTSAMPATMITGYPPAIMGPDEVFAQVAWFYGLGWRRFKTSVGVSDEQSVARLRAARRAAPDAWLGCDGAWTFSDVEAAADFVNSLSDVGLGWFEDVFAPGDARSVARLRRLTSTPIAMGDEQGGAYYPQALLDADAVDVIRIDLTCMGGVSGSRAVLDACTEKGVAVAPHMYAHVHSRVLPAWGLIAPIEWGAQWTGVDPYADSLEQPVLNSDGTMQPLADAPGFGELVNREWLATQDVHDPHGILGI
jgi:L-alanine-DL-glutamate epimerase-like enolase superfamily enzyme